MDIIAIITARGGSKRIPKKNIKEFCGKPIISYSIEAALNSGIFNEVMVSTDNVEIARIAESYGASVPFLRSGTASSDYAKTTDVLLEVISKYETKGKFFGLICCIYPTAPFITPKKLQNALDILYAAKADSLMPVVQFSFPPQRAVVIKDNKLKYQYPEFSSVRSQDLENIYHDCGQFYFCYTSALKKYKTVVTPDTATIVMPEEEVQDIDNLSDWHIAELKYKTFILKDGE